MIEFLTDMPFWAWFGLAGVLLLAEILTGTTFLLWPAVAAAILGLLTTVQLDGRWATQWLLFAGLTVGLGIVGRPYAERWINLGSTDRPGLNQFGLNRRGKRGVVTGEFIAGRGRIRLGDTQWSARLDDETVVVAEGDPVEVIGTEGTVMVIRPLV